MKSKLILFVLVVLAAGCSARRAQTNASAATSDANQTAPGTFQDLTPTKSPVRASASADTAAGDAAAKPASVAATATADSQPADTSVVAEADDESQAPAETTATPAAANDAAKPASAASASAAETAAAPVAADPTKDSAPSATAATATPAEAASTAPAAVVAANDAAQPAATTNTPATSTTPATTNAPATTNTPAESASAQTGGVIPLIVMDDVPLTDAIRNLARQAGLNYMLDPRIGFGQAGPDGKITAQPSVSLRWENITAEQALNALLNNYSLQLVDDPKSKISRVTIKDPAAPPPLVTKIIQLKFASPSNILSSVSAALIDKRSKVMPDNRTSQLVVVATEAEMDGVDKLVERLDTQTKQVLIETRLMETEFDPSSKKGIDWTGTLQGQRLAVGNNLQQNSPSASLNNTLSQSFPTMLLDTAKGFNPATAFLDADGVSAVLSFLNTYSETKIISTPRTVTLDNEPAMIEVGTLFPIVNTTAGTANTTGGSQINYSNLTVRLEVTPRISANNFVHLKVNPRVMRLGDPVSSVVGGVQNTVDSFNKREMVTAVLIPSGNTLVMGGLVGDEVQRTVVKVPLLGDIPFLGGAFRSDSKTRTKSNLIVFITPTIVEDGDYQPTTTEFLKSPVPTKDSVEGDWSAWDSGKPASWGKSENN